MIFEESIGRNCFMTEDWKSRDFLFVEIEREKMTFLMRVVLEWWMNDSDSVSGSCSFYRKFDWKTTTTTTTTTNMTTTTIVMTMKVTVSPSIDSSLRIRDSATSWRRRVNDGGITKTMTTMTKTMTTETMTSDGNESMMASVGGDIDD